MGEELVSSTPVPTHSEQFTQQFPYYLSIGMTYEQYWYKDCTLVIPYRKAEEIRRDRRNQEMWLQGSYVYDALLCASPLLHAFAPSGSKAHPYLNQPYPLTKSQIEKLKVEKEKDSEQKAVIGFQDFAAAFNQRQMDKEKRSNVVDTRTAAD